MDGFGDPTNRGIDPLIEFKDNFYAGTSKWDPPNQHGLGGEIWRSGSGTAWTQVVDQGFGDPVNGSFEQFAVFENSLYASTWSFTNAHGSEIWRSASGNTGEWQRVVSNGFGDVANGVTSMEVFNGYLYAGTQNWDPVAGGSTGGQVWRTNDGTTWLPVNTDGFGDADNYDVGSLAAFGGYLYAGTTNYSAIHGSTGGQIWRCAVCSGSDWVRVEGDGLGDAENYSVVSLVVFNGALHAVTRNWATGAEVWRTNDGVAWAQINPDGFGSSNNGGPRFDNSVAAYNNRLVVGISNYTNGAEVWQLLEPRYLPMIMR